MEAASPESRVAVGRVLKPHGLQGYVKVEPWVERPDRFAELETVWLVNEAGRVLLKTKIEAQARLGRFALLKFLDIPDLNAAEQIRRCLVEIPQSQVPALPAGCYYQFELIGLQAVDLDGEIWGQVSQVENYPAHDVYHVQQNDGRTVLVPAVAEIVKEIDRKGGRLVIDRRALEEAS